MSDESSTVVTGESTVAAAVSNWKKMTEVGGNMEYHNDDNDVGNDQLTDLMKAVRSQQLKLVKKLIAKRTVRP